MAASRQPVSSTGPCHPRPSRLLVSPATPTGPHVYLTASKIWYRLKRFPGTKCHNIHVWYHLKRFLGTIYYENGAWLRPAWRFFGGTHADAERVVCWRAPAAVVPLEVRFAHPVRLSPATHSQGHGRPCLQRHHRRRGFCCHVVFPDGHFHDMLLENPDLVKKSRRIFFTIIVFESHSFEKTGISSWKITDFI